MDTNSLSAGQFGNQNGGGSMPTPPSSGGQSLKGPLGSSGQPGQGSALGAGMGSAAY